MRVSLKKRLRGADDSTVSSSTDRSASAVRVSAKTRPTTVQPRQSVGRLSNQIVTIGGGGSSGVFSRLGNR